MFSQGLFNFTWLDVIVIGFIGCCAWAGFHKGAVAELFKILGVTVAIVVSLHFYLPFGNVVTRYAPVIGNAGYLIPLLGLSVIVVLFFRIIREGAIVLFQNDNVSAISRVLGVALGCARGLLLGSMVLVGCLIADTPWLTRVVQKTCANQVIGLASPMIYSVAYDMVIKPVFPSEEKNMAVIELAGVHRIPAE